MSAKLRKQKYSPEYVRPSFLGKESSMGKNKTKYTDQVRAESKVGLQIRRKQRKSDI